MVTEKTESTIIIKVSKASTKEFTSWLLKEAKLNKVLVTYVVSHSLFFRNKIHISTIGADEDIDKYEKYIENKLMQL